MLDSCMGSRLDRARSLLGSCSKMTIFNLLFLLNFTVTQTIASEAFIKVTKFQVPTQAKVGDTFRLACYYEVSKDQRLYAMKMFKDGNEFYRWLPSENTSQKFRVDGLTIEFVPAKPLEVLVKNADPRTAGRYKCMITVEGTFKSISQEKDLKVVNRTTQHLMQLSGSGGSNDAAVVGAGSSLGEVVFANRQQQQHQRHAVQMRKQQQQQQQLPKNGARGAQTSTSPVKEGQQMDSSPFSSPASPAINCSMASIRVGCATALMTLMMMITLLVQSAVVAHTTTTTTTTDLIARASPIRWQ